MGLRSSSFPTARDGVEPVPAEIAVMRREALAPREAEFGQPQWVFGMSTYAFAGKDVICSYVSNGIGHLATIDLARLDLAQADGAGGGFKALDVPFTDFSSMRARGSRVVFRGGSAVKPASIVMLNLYSQETEVLKKSTSVSDDPDLAKYFSEAQGVEFPTGHEKTAFGLYYPAFNPDYEAPEGERPPLLVKCHFAAALRPRPAVRLT